MRASTNMRTPTELQEKIDHLSWFKHELSYYFRVTPLGPKKHAVLAAFYRTIDNEIAMLRWVLGQTENTWSDDLSGSMDFRYYVDDLPPTEFPHLPANRKPAEYWGARPSPVCAYFSGPDSPKDDPNFDFSKVGDPSTWTKQAAPVRPTSRFYEAGGPDFINSHFGYKASQ